MPPARTYVVKREPGPGTATGVGDIITDNHGNRYRQISAGEASHLRSSTAGQVYTIHDDGSIS